MSDGRFVIPRVRERRRRAWPIGIGLVLAPLALLTAVCVHQQSPQPDPPPPPSAAPTPVAVLPDRKMVMTYFFYWYDTASGLHLREADGLSDHLPADPAPSYRNAAWFRKELSDMAYAGIDVALPVYWGSGREAWSTEGLRTMADARESLVREGKPAPAIGMFFDTTIVGERDLTTEDGKAWFYGNFRDFFRFVPRKHWALVNGRPVIFLFTTDWTAAFDQSVFDYVYASFERDFGVRPYIVREVSWDYPIIRWKGGVTSGTRERDYTRAIVTDNSYLWGSAQNGFVDRGDVSAIGPGYDDTRVPGRQGFIRSRDDGRWYRDNFAKAQAAGKRILVIETWNEIHEGSDVSETREYGRLYLDLTRQISEAFKK